MAEEFHVNLAEPPKKEGFPWAKNTKPAILWSIPITLVAIITEFVMSYISLLPRMKLQEAMVSGQPTQVPSVVGTLMLIAVASTLISAFILYVALKTQARKGALRGYDQKLSFIFLVIASAAVTIFMFNGLSFGAWTISAPGMFALFLAAVVPFFVPDKKAEHS